MNLMTQDMKSGDEVTPLDQLSQWPPTKRHPRYSNFIRYCTRMHQDLFFVFFHECILIKKC